MNSWFEAAEFARSYDEGIMIKIICVCRVIMNRMGYDEVDGKGLGRYRQVISTYSCVYLCVHVSCDDEVDGIGLGRYRQVISTFLSIISMCPCIYVCA
jgi:hypothetical protein